MDWLRRNWPDLLIVIALIAVIGGIAMTLLTGGFNVPLLGTSPSSPSVSQPASPPADTGPDSADASDAATPGTTEPAGDVAADGSDAVVSGDADDTATTGGISVLPPSDPSADTAASDAASTASSDATPSGSDATSAPAEAPSTGSSSASTTSAPSATSSAQTSTSAAAEPPYRVSVGAFSNADNAERFAQTFRAAGFPVFIGTQDALSIVLVGPYDTRAEAEDAAARVVAGDFDVAQPVIFRLDAGPVPGQSEASSDAASTPSAGEASASPATSEPADSAPATSASGTFLQIGAYNSAEAAQPMIDRAEALGFDVDVRTEAGLLKLVLGPFDDAALASARSTLDQAGIEHFPRSD